MRRPYLPTYIASVIKRAALLPYILLYVIALNGPLILVYVLLLLFLFGASTGTLHKQILIFSMSSRRTDGRS